MLKLCMLFKFFYKAHSGRETIDRSESRRVRVTGWKCGTYDDEGKVLGTSLASDIGSINTKITSFPSEGLFAEVPHSKIKPYFHTNLVSFYYGEAGYKLTILLLWFTNVMQRFLEENTEMQITKTETTL